METASPLKIHSSQLGSACNRPVPLGVAVKMPTERGYGVELMVLEVVRGRSVDEVLRAAGFEMEPAADGHEYLPARVRFGFFCKAKGSPDMQDCYRLSADSFQAASADGAITWDLPDPVRQSQGLIHMTVSVGETREGWVAVQVPQTEKEPLLVFHRRHSRSNYVLTSTWRPFWFRLFAADPMRLEESCAECRA